MELSRKNKHPHLMGTSGYLCAKQRWAKEDEAAQLFREQPLFSDFTDDRVRDWCRARTKVSPGGAPIWRTAEEEEVYQRMVSLSQQASQGSFVA